MAPPPLTPGTRRLLARYGGLGLPAIPTAKITKRRHISRCRRALFASAWEMALVRCPMGLPLTPPLLSVGEWYGGATAGDRATRRCQGL